MEVGTCGWVPECQSVRMAQSQSHSLAQAQSRTRSRSGDLLLSRKCHRDEVRLVFWARLNDVWSLGKECRGFVQEGEER